MQATAPSLEQLAAFYRCSTKTLQRLKADGVDVHNALEVANAVVQQRTRSLPMLERLTLILEEIEN